MPISYRLDGWIWRASSGRAAAGAAAAAPSEVLGWPFARSQPAQEDDFAQVLGPDLREPGSRLVGAPSEPNYVTLGGL